MLLGPLKLVSGSLLLGGWTYLTCCVPLGSATFAQHMQRVMATPEAQALQQELGVVVHTRILLPARETVREQLLAWAREQDESEVASR